MARYFKLCKYMVADQDAVGVGLDTTDVGTMVVCVSLRDGEWAGLSVASAGELYRLLRTLRHLYPTTRYLCEGCGKTGDTTATVVHLDTCIGGPIVGPYPASLD